MSNAWFLDFSGNGIEYYWGGRSGRSRNPLTTNQLSYSYFSSALFACSFFLEFYYTLGNHQCRAFGGRLCATDPGSKKILMK